MLQELELKKGMKVLEIGTGFGYNSALLGKIVKPGKVYTVEIDEDLTKIAAKNLKKIKANNIKVVNGDGSKGYEKEKPFDRIIFTAAAIEIPKPLKEQLKEQGIILGPVGGDYGQSLVKCRKIKNKFDCYNLGGFIFVKMHGEFA